MSRQIRGRGRGLTANRNFGNSSRTVDSRVSNLIHGRTFRPTLMPPLFSAQPWSNATVRSIVTVTQKFSTVRTDTIVKNICGQLGLFYQTKDKNYNINIEFRILSISVWFKQDQGYLRLLPLDLIDSRNSPNHVRELTNIDCMAQKNMYASGGYVWPVTHQSLVFQDEASPVFALEGNTTGDVEYHLKVLWRGASALELNRVYVYDVQPSTSRRCYSNAEEPPDTDDEDIKSLFSDLDFKSSKKSQ